MTDLVACTIIAHNYLPLARVLARSFLDQHPDARFVVAFIDKPIETRSLENECFEILPITDIDLGDEGWEYMATGYEVTEFATSVKPYVLRQLLRSADCVLYIDPDIFVFQPLDPLIESTIDAGMSLTPHCLQPIARNGTGPTEAHIMQAGVYNLGYIGVTKAAIPFLDWWAERLRRDALIDPSNQLFTDQRWIDLAVPIFAPHIERSTAYNVAYWNIDQRRLWRDGDTPMIDDSVLRFFHFSGYDPRAPHWLSKYQPEQPRTLMSESMVLGDLCNEYGAALRGAGFGASPPAPYGWAEAFPGFPLEPAIRKMFHAELLLADKLGHELPPSPFVEGGREKFCEWLREVDPKNPRRLPRYLEAIWRQRPDLRDAFPEVADGNPTNMLKWQAVAGRREHASVRMLASLDSGAFDAEPSLARSVGKHSGGVDLVGYLNAELGVGEAGRLASSALSAAGVPVSAVACKRTTSRQDHAYVTSGVAMYDTTLMAVNADQFKLVKDEFSSGFFDGRYVIGQWFWEVDAFPVRYHEAFELVDEVWAATMHIKNAFEAVHPSVPIVHMQLPLVAPPVDAEITRADFGLDDRFMFLFSFDLLSRLDRKNPIGLIEAFSRAFASSEGPVLVLKVINGQQCLNDLERLRWAARDRSDIIIIDEYFSAARSGALMAHCDCYVSLHRAEGLGLTMAEAMALGKPVIATNYSGNLDFMTDTTAHLLGWTPRKIGSGQDPYPADSLWAEPNLDEAAAAMRKVFSDPIAAQALGRAAQTDIETRFSPEATGQRMKQRLQHVWSRANV